MTSAGEEPETVEGLISSPELADALESHQFKKFLDQVPIAIALSEFRGEETIIYVNPQFERLSGVQAGQTAGQSWDLLQAERIDGSNGPDLASAIVQGSELLGTFNLQTSGAQHTALDVHSNLIQDDTGRPKYRLVAFVPPSSSRGSPQREAQDRAREKDLRLRELQHRVKNNLQMITALIRLEMRNAATIDRQAFERLSGRVAALSSLYDVLSIADDEGEIDLGAYLSQIAALVMASHATEGIKLDLQVHAYPASINVAMPTGLVVNELLINSLKHAFRDREGGTIRLHSTVDEAGCEVVVADDGVGMPAGKTWPQRGKLGELMVQTLVENARADFTFRSIPQDGTRAVIKFKRSAALASST
ncbi:sensor histidine kinase [Rhodoligotrophos defluvii]|uniref:sensor histidine kinase n=1 Tax=Rhodoligotrophos defluvii TaxID=2561934 RepID=UPI0010CA0D40|nr:sensor histidine kinase [Rhodoligotrophos defluvii]